MLRRACSEPPKAEDHAGAQRRRTVVVSTFPPLRDGIARYAEQFVRHARQEGQVLTVGLPGSNADRELRLDGQWRPLRLLRVTAPHDRLLLQWHPEFFISGRVWSRCLSYLSLALVFRFRDGGVVVHEPDTGARDDRRGLRALPRAVEQRARRICWRSPRELVFHSARERDNFTERLRDPLIESRLVLEEHGKFFRPTTTASKHEARAELGIAADGTVFLCIGFWGRHKGFDRAVRAFASVLQERARLYLVGSALYDTPEVRAYAEELCQLAATTPGVEFHERFVSDLEFDLWMTAADAVLVPYRQAASSGVVARAQLLQRRVIAADAGGLAEQLGPNDILVRSDEQLCSAMLDVALNGAAGAEPRPLEWPGSRSG